MADMFAQNSASKNLTIDEEEFKMQSAAHENAEDAEETTMQEIDDED